MNALLPMFFLGLSCLIYLGYQDIKTREINIIPLFVLSAIGFVYFVVIGIIKGFVFMYLLQLIITFVFVVIIYLLGKLTIYAYIGEGDLLALMAISAVSGVSVLFAPFVFLLAMILMLSLPIALFFFNLLKGNFPKKPIGESMMLMTFGFPKRIDRLKNFYTPLEKFSFVNKKIISKTIIRPDSSPEKQIEELKIFSKKFGIKKVWVSPLIPFVVTMIIAYSIIGVLTYFNALSFLSNFAVSFV